MTPDRAASIFRELLDTPVSELGHLPRRVGLQGHPTPPDLQQAQELLKALAVALESGPGPNWDRIQTACAAMVARHGTLPREATVGPPAWVQGPPPPKPTLGDPAPGSPGYAAAEEQRERFVPQAAPPAYGQAPAPAPQPHSAGYPQGPQAGYPQAPRGGYPAAPPAPHGGYPAAPTPQPPPQPAAPPQPPAPAAPPAPPPPPKRHAPPAATPSQPNPDDTHISAGDIRNSVAKYAAFCAACAAQPERVFQTLVDYGVTSPEARETLDEDWQDRFDDDPELHAKWERLFRQFREQLTR